MTRPWMLPSRWAEPLAFTLLGLVLFIRYPIHFIVYPPFLMDFEVYHAAAVQLVQGHGAFLYAPTTNEMMVFKYAPIWALAWAPLGWLPKHASGIVWTAVGVLALLLTLCMCARLCRHHGIRYHPLTAALVIGVLSRPLAEEMGNGQANLLWGGFTVGAIYAATCRRPWLSAASMAAAILLKLPTLVFLPYLVLRRQWAPFGRLLALLLGEAVVGSVLVAPAQPFQLLGAWTRALLNSGSAYALMIGNQSVLAFLGRFLTADGYALNIANLPRDVLVWITAGLGAVSLWLLGRPVSDPRQPPIRFLYDSAMLMVVMVVFSPSCWTATYMALIFPMFLAAASLTHRLLEGRRDAGSLLLAGLVLFANLFTHQKVWRFLSIPPRHGEGYLFLVFMPLPWLSLALMVLLWRQRQLMSRPD